MGGGGKEERKQKKVHQCETPHFPAQDLLSSVVLYLQMAVTSSLEKTKKGRLAAASRWSFDRQDLTSLLYAGIHIRP